MPSKRCNHGFLRDVAPALCFTCKLEAKLAAEKAEAEARVGGTYHDPRHTPVAAEFIALRKARTRRAALARRKEAR